MVSKASCEIKGDRAEIGSNVWDYAMNAKCGASGTLAALVM